MKKIIFLLALLGLVNAVAKAQDKIYLKGKTGYIKAKVIEVGLDEIKYKEYANEEGVTYTVEKDEVDRIEYQNGKKESFFNPMALNVRYDDMNRNIIKFNLFKPLTGASHVSLEHGIKMGQSYEAHLIAVGLGMNQVAYRDYNNINNYYGTPYYAKQRGAIVGMSYKAIFLPDYIQRGIKYRHILQGSFVRPTVYVGNFSYLNYSQKYLPTGGYTIESARKNIVMGGFMVELGKQWIFSNRLSLELYIGIGYGMDNRKSVINDINNFQDLFASNYAFTRPNFNGTLRNTSIAYSSGVKLGYAFKWKKLDGSKKVAIKRK